MANASMVPMQEFKAKVGIFMPYYNMDEYIDEALDSLYSQTFNDFTVIIADDASPSKKTVKKLSGIHFPRCQIYFEKKNLGLIRISNKYMAKIDAEYIMLFSPDDKMHPDLLKEEVEYLDSHPNVHAVCTNIQEFGDGNQVIEYDDESCKLPHMLIENRFSGAALVRKSAWLAAGMHDTNKDLYPNLDYDLWLSMLEKGFALGTIPKTLFYWRVVKKSLSHNVNSSQILTFRKALLRKYSALYKEHAEYTIGRYLEIVSKFESYYATSEEGHDWLDNQYHSLMDENASLREHLDDSIQRPYVRSAYHRLHSHFKK